MTIYLIAAVLLFLAGFIVKDKRIEYLFVFFLLLISMFRGDMIGDDTIEYMTFNPNYEPTGIKGFEFSFFFIYSLIPILGRYTVIWCFSLVLFVSVLLACRRFGVRPAIVFFFFLIFEYFNLSLNISRQFAAAGLLLYAFSFLYENGRNKYLFFLLIFFAGSIHSSAWFFALVYILRYVNLSKVKPYLLFLIIILLVIISQVFFVPYFEKWATLYTLTAQSDSLSAYGDYFDQTEALTGGSIGNLILTWGVTIIHIYILFRLIAIKSQKALVVSALFFASIFIALVLDPLYGNLTRLKYNLTIINIVAYAYYYLYSKDKYKIPVLASILLFFGYIWIRNMQGVCYWTVPYQTMFSNRTFLQ